MIGLLNSHPFHQVLTRLPCLLQIPTPSMTSVTSNVTPIPLTFQNQPRSLRSGQAPCQYLLSTVHHANGIANQLPRQKAPPTWCRQVPLVHHRLRFPKSLISERGRRVHLLPAKQKHMAFLPRYQRRHLERRQNYHTSSVVHGSFGHPCHGESSVLLSQTICTALLPHLTLTLFHGESRQPEPETILGMTLGISRWSRVFNSISKSWKVPQPIVTR